MKLVENKYSIKTIKPTISISPDAEQVMGPKKTKPRSPALIKAQQKYYEKNKAKITKQQTLYNEKYTKLTHKCECGDIVTNSAKYKHIKSDRHIRRLDNIKNGRLAGCTEGEKYIDCPCGGHYIYKQRHQHFRTQKHKFFEAEQKKKVEEQVEKQKQLLPEYTQAKLRAQLRRMLLGEGMDTATIDTNPNVNSSEIKEI